MAVFRVAQLERRKKVAGYGGRYEVGDQGSVFSGGSELSVVDGRYVYLSWQGHVDRVSVSYLVARAFVRNAECRPYVRHKNGDVKDNRAENLEWCEVKERCSSGGRKEQKRAVMCYDAESGEFVGRWDSVRAASEATGVARSLITRCADGKGRRAKQYVFVYV